MKEKWQTFQQDSQTFRPIAFCAKCGSTNIDHKPIGRLVCFNCNNQAHWSPDRFRLARDTRPITNSEKLQAFFQATGRDWIQGMDDAQSMIAKEARDDFDWYADTVKKVEAFLDSLATAQVKTTTETGPKYNPREIEKLLQNLSAMTDGIEVILKSLAK